MSSDFGDESGEKLVDWMLDSGQDAGDAFMCSSAERLKSAFHRARTSSSALGDGASEERPEWAKLSMADFEELPGYDSLKELIDERLDADAIEHDFFRDEQRREWLLFKVEDAPDVSEAFRDLEQQTDKALEKSLQKRGKTREQVRDEESLETRAKAAREASRSMDSGRDRERVLERFEMRSK